MRSPRPFTRRDREDLIQLLYRFHTRAIDEKNFDVVKSSALTIQYFSQQWTPPPSKGLKPAW